MASHDGSGGTTEAIGSKALPDEEAPVDQTRAAGETCEGGDAPADRADSRAGPTRLFLALHRREWWDASRRLETHPEEAGVWAVGRAVEGEGTGVRDARRRILPLHLYVALAGRADGERAGPRGTDDRGDEIDAPDDEKDEIDVPDGEGEGNEGTRREGGDAWGAPPTELLASLLSAHPRAASCADDQGAIPLHLAIRGNSPLEVVERLLDSDPSSVYRKDVQGRDAFFLAERAFAKSVHKQRVREEIFGKARKGRSGNGREAREVEYASLMDLLTAAACCVPPPAEPRPREETRRSQWDEDEEARKEIRRLRGENSALRREAAKLRRREEINERLLRQLVDKLRTYEEQRSVDIENYDEVFGSRDGIGDGNRGVLLSVSGDNDGSRREHETAEGGWQTEKRPFGGEGVCILTPTRNRGNVNVISPSSTLTEGTEDPNVTPTRIHRLPV